MNKGVKAALEAIAGLLRRVVRVARGLWHRTMSASTTMASGFGAAWRAVAARTRTIDAMAFLRRAWAEIRQVAAAGSARVAVNVPAFLRGAWAAIRRIAHAGGSATRKVIRRVVTVADSVPLAEGGRRTRAALDAVASMLERTAKAGGSATWTAIRWGVQVAGSVWRTVNVPAFLRGAWAEIRQVAAAGSARVAVNVPAFLRRAWMAIGRIAHAGGSATRRVIRRVVAIADSVPLAEGGRRARVALDAVASMLGRVAKAAGSATRKAIRLGVEVAGSVWRTVNVPAFLRGAWAAIRQVAAVGSARVAVNVPAFLRGAWMAIRRIAHAGSSATRRVIRRVVAVADSVPLAEGGRRTRVALDAVASMLGRTAKAAGSATRKAIRRVAAVGWIRIALAVTALVVLLGGVPVALWLAAPTAAPGAAPVDGETVVFTVVPGATFGQITDTLVARGLIRRPRLFRAYGRLRRDDRNVRSGTYVLDAGTGWPSLLDALVEGRVRMEPVTIPEGMTLPGIAVRIARVTELAPDTVRVRLDGEDAHARWNLPGPGLEGYLFPDTYLFARSVALETVVQAMTERYRSYWTPERRARAGELGLSEREVVTLASIIQAEVRVPAEMPTISAVYHNRLRVGMPLQADPTVLYALGGHRPRLLFAAIDSVADSPYNTYTQGGLPPGPIGAPGAGALDAALHPAEVDYLYFVANADGSHTFSRSLTEHNRAVARARREAAGAGPGGA